MAIQRRIAQFMSLIAGGVIVATAWGQQAKPDPLLAVDQNRNTVVERIVGQWGESLAQSGAGITPTQLRDMLNGLRADRLLAASLAGSLPGLRDVLATEEPGTAPLKPGRVAAKTIVGSGSDLVYTPVTPCRLFDTRVSQGGLGTPTLNVRRSYGAITPVAMQGGPGGCAAGAAATVALMQIGTLAPISGNGLLQGGAQGVASFPNALILYQPGDQYGTAVAMPLNLGNGEFDLVEQFATADLYGDLLGYFEEPQPAPQKQTVSYNLAPGAISAPIPIPVNDVPVTVQAVNLSLGYRGVTQVSVLRCCNANPGSFLEWVGLSSPGGAAVVAGYSATAGTLITQIDFGHVVLIEVNDPTSIRIHNTNIAPQFGALTITW